MSQDEKRAIIPPGAGNWSALGPGFLGPQLRDVYLITGSPETPLLAATSSSFFSGLGSQTWTVSAEAGAPESIPSLGASWGFLFGHSWAALRLGDSGCPGT